MRLTWMTSSSTNASVEDWEWQALAGWCTYEITAAKKGHYCSMKPINFYYVHLMEARFNRERLVSILTVQAAGPCRESGN